MQVLLTRPLTQVREFERKLILNNYQPLLFPSLVIKPLNATLTKVNFDIVIFISVNAVNYGAKYLTKISKKKPILIAAIGTTTKKRLEHYGFKVDITPTGVASSEALLATKALVNISDKNILIIRGRGGREILKNNLSINNSVLYLEVYYRKIANTSIEHKHSLNKFLANKLGVIMLNSIDTLEAFLTIVDNINTNYVTKLQQYPVIVLGNRVAKAVKKSGFVNHFVATSYDNDSLLTCLNKIRNH